MLKNKTQELERPILDYSSIPDYGVFNSSNNISSENKTEELERRILDYSSISDYVELKF